MSESTTKETCRLGEKCILWNGVHAPPVKWIEKLLSLFDKAIDNGLLKEEEPGDLVGLYIKLAVSGEYKILTVDPEGGVQMVSEVSKG